MSRITNIAIRQTTHAKVKQIADANRMTLLDTADVLAEGWELLSPEQRRQVIERPADETPDRPGDTH